MTSSLIAGYARTAEAQALVAQGYKALKLRFGDTVQRDIVRLAAIRKAFGAEIDIMADANTGYQVTATPLTVGKTGDLGYCMDENGLIKSDPAGGTNCTQPISQ